MPDKPTWYGRLPQVLTELKGLPRPWVDRATVQQLLGVGRRRAQQILEPCVTYKIGANGVADRDAFIRHLEQLARGEAVFYEQRRRRKVAEEIGKLREAWLHQPRVMVEAPGQIVNQTFAGLKDVSITPGRITIEFETPQSALESLLALAMAIGNEFAAFERLATSGG